jgi:hypothetical protein
MVKRWEKTTLEPSRGSNVRPTVWDTRVFVLSNLIHVPVYA